MPIEISDKIDEGHPGCLCPLCDQEILSFEAATIADAHGSQYLVHTSCLEEDEDSD